MNCLLKYGTLITVSNVELSGVVTTQLCILVELNMYPKSVYAVLLLCVCTSHDGLLRVDIEHAKQVAACTHQTLYPCTLLHWMCIWG